MENLGGDFNWAAIKHTTFVMVSYFHIPRTFLHKITLN
jgi:hypothetical protein